MDCNSTGCETCDTWSNFISKNAPKTLLDEFAMAALVAIIRNNQGTATNDDIDDLCALSYDVAAAMMRERARRDDNGNIKEL